MKAVVMAGGQGTRLRPLTSNQPKPMLPIVGTPMMEHVLRLAGKHGFNDIVATVHFLASIVRHQFGDGSDLGLSIEYAAEGAPLGTAGSVKNAAALLDDRFLVLSGDSLTDIDLAELVRFHKDRAAAVTVTLKRVEDPLEFGVVITDAESRVERFLEKPGWGDVFSDTINTGIYVVERDVLDHVPPGQEFDFARDLFPLLLEQGFPLYGYVTDRYWTDIGTIEAYTGAHVDVLNRKVDVEIGGFELKGGVWLGEGAEIDPDAELKGPLYIGENCRVESGVRLREYTVLGRGVTVKSGASVRRTIVHDYAYIGASSTLRGCVVGKNTDIKFAAEVEEGAVVANDCTIANGAIVQPQVKIYPFKTVEPGAIVSQSIIWQSGGTRGLFGERGVAGLINVDVTPEMVLRLALAYASLLPKGSTVVACRDPTRAARVFKRAMLVGLNAGGIECHDLELAPTPVARHYARSARVVGGVSVRTAPQDASSVEIVFFDERGIDISPRVQRQLERAYYRDDLRRAFHHDMGDLRFPARGLEYYAGGLLDSVDVEVIRQRRPKLVVDYGGGATVLTGPRVLGGAGAEVLAVNAVLDEERTAPSDADRAEILRNLARLVRAGGAEMGALIDPTGERLTLVDGEGRMVSPRAALLAMLRLAIEDLDAPRVALTVATSRVAEDIVRSRNGQVVWTRIAPAALMAAADRGRCDLAGDEELGLVFPGFLPAHDALLCLLKLLEMLARRGTTLQEAVDELPEAHVAHREVVIPWEAKGTVMRLMIERWNGDHVVTVDGVKVYRGEDWALVVPHPQEPVVRVWAESGTAEGAEALSDEFARLVEELRS